MNKIWILPGMFIVFFTLAMVMVSIQNAYETRESLIRDNISNIYELCYQLQDYIAKINKSIYIPENVTDNLIHMVFTKFGDDFPGIYFEEIAEPKKTTIMHYTKIVKSGEKYDLLKKEFDLRKRFLDKDEITIGILIQKEYMEGYLMQELSSYQSIKNVVVGQKFSIGHHKFLKVEEDEEYSMCILIEEIINNNLRSLYDITSLTNIILYLKSVGEELAKFLKQKDFAEELLIKKKEVEYLYHSKIAPLSFDLYQKYMEMIDFTILNNKEKRYCHMVFPWIRSIKERNYFGDIRQFQITKEYEEEIKDTPFYDCKYIDGPCNNWKNTDTNMEHLVDSINSKENICIIRYMFDAQLCKNCQLFTSRYFGILGFCYIKNDVYIHI